MSVQSVENTWVVFCIGISDECRGLVRCPVPGSTKNYECVLHRWTEQHKFVVFITYYPLSVLYIWLIFVGL